MNFHINKQSDVQNFIQQIKYFISKYTDDDQVISSVLTISSEIIYNIIKYSDEGEFSISIKNSSFIIKAKDNGKGFTQIVEQALLEGYSQAGSLGLGLPSIVRMSDDLNITTSQTGTHIECIKDF